MKILIFVKFRIQDSLPVMILNNFSFAYLFSWELIINALLSYRASEKK